ncbi:MAG: phage protease, partial [Planctomycetota bacterium]
AIHSAALTNKPAIVGMQPIVNRADAADDAADEPLTVLRNELDLPSDTATEDVLVAASRRLVDLQRDMERRHVEERIREAMRAGKLVEAQRTWAEALVAREEDLFEEWFRTAPVVVKPGMSAPPHTSDGVERKHHAAASRARAEFRTNRVLSGLTTEEAYVADAMRAISN